MPTFYNFRENGLNYSFDDIFVPADLFREGNLFAWGNGNSGKLGDNSLFNNRSTPVTTFAGGTNWKQVSAGYIHTAAIKTDGTLWVWGNESLGRLGNARDGAFSHVETPITTFAGGTNWKQASCGRDFTAAIKTDGTLWTWGYGLRGKLGNAVTTGNISTPVTTFAGGTNWKQVSVGIDHTAATKTDGTLWTWGGSYAGLNGALGNATTDNRSTPVTTFAGGTDWKQVSAGGFYTTAIKTDGTLWTWGAGIYGRLGNNQPSDRSTPVTTFSGGTNWKQVSSGRQHTAAIKTDGTLWTWGNGNNGQLGDATTTNTLTPITTFAGGTNWKQVSSGGSPFTGVTSHTAAIKTDGTLWTWGNGSTGQLGTNDTINKSTPITTFAGGTNWKQVFLGFNYTTATTYDDPVL